VGQNCTAGSASHRIPPTRNPVPSPRGRSTTPFESATRPSRRAASATREKSTSRSPRPRWRLKSWRNKEGKWVQGGEWDASAVHRHITNVVYIGKVDYEGAIYDGENQPIIDAATFDQAASIRADGRIDRGAEARNTTGYLLRGLIRCVVCNSIMTTATSGSHGRIYRYYSCTKATKRGKNACTVRSCPAPRSRTSSSTSSRSGDGEPRSQGASRKP